MYDVLTQVQSLREQLHRPRFRENGRRKQRVPVELQKVTGRFSTESGRFSAESQRFSGAILHDLCIFNGKCPNPGISVEVFSTCARRSRRSADRGRGPALIHHF